MIAAVRRRALVVRVRAKTLTRRVDREVNRLMVRAWPSIARAAKRCRATATRWARRADRRLRPVAVRFFRLLSALERRLLRVRDLAIRAATRASAVLTQRRAICGVILASAACLAVAQFVEYRAVEVGQPGYAGLSAATPPTVAVETAGEAHAYLLLPVALLAAVLAAVAMRNERRRGLGRVVIGLGLLSLAVVLLIDRPAGLDAAAQEAQFSGATAVLEDGFYAQIAAAFGLMLGGILLAREPRARLARSKRRSRPRKPSPARTQGGPRRARTSGA
ncbi:MAG TPA: Trp biosynthesis-associated membrane protein [Solirubrobacterales bacterium]|nr:Trp biosynthesis-associated membrane protein [Solirubrobacterales bacterium]